MKNFDKSWENFLKEIFSLAGFEIEDTCIPLLKIYGEELINWNKKKNLTSITSPDKITVLHFLDSVYALSFIDRIKGKKVLDVGTGGGFPGLILKIFAPELDIYLLDASRKKISFLKYISSKLGLKDIHCIHDRAEKFTRENLLEFNFIISRAFTSMDNFFDLVWPGLAEDGRIIAMKGPDTDDELSCFRERKYSYGDRKIDGGSVNYSIFEYELPVVQHKRKIISLTC